MQQYKINKKATIWICVATLITFLVISWRLCILLISSIDATHRNIWVYWLAIIGIIIVWILFVVVLFYVSVGVFMIIHALYNRNEIISNSGEQWNTIKKSTRNFFHEIFTIKKNIDNKWYLWAMFISYGNYHVKEMQQGIPPTIPNLITEFDKYRLQILPDIQKEQRKYFRF